MYEDYYIDYIIYMRTIVMLRRRKRITLIGNEEVRGNHARGNWILIKEVFRLIMKEVFI